MKEYEQLYQFENLYRAHQVARLGKRGNKEVIEFEMRLSENLTILADQLRRGTYRIGGYYTFMVHDPKDRVIHALHYRDRIVQHCLCDEILAPMIEPKLIYDNAACRIGKGTDFARDRLTGFLRENHRKHGQGYFLKCDIRRFFDSVDHEVLKRQLHGLFHDPRLVRLLDQIVDSYEVSPGKGLPLGNQTSQWFAIYYLNGFDRLIKERLRIRYYTRYMDDCILVHHDKAHLRACLNEMRAYIRDVLKLEFNAKTQIFPAKNGAEYLGFRFVMNSNGGVIRRLSKTAKTRLKHRLRKLAADHSAGKADYEDALQTINSYREHLSKGHTYRLKKNTLGKLTLRRRGASYGPDQFRTLFDRTFPAEGHHGDPI